MRYFYICCITAYLECYKWLHCWFLQHNINTIKLLFRFSLLLLYTLLDLVKKNIKKNIKYIKCKI